MKIKLIAAALCGLSLSAVTMAEEAAKKDVHDFKTSAELGFLFKTGNTDSGDLKAGLDLDHSYNQWTNSVRLDVLYKTLKVETTDESGNVDDDYETTDQKLTFTTQTNYKLSDKNKNYAYGSFWYEDDRFSSFDNQSSVSAGWGKEWYKTEKSSLFADIGPGYKRDVIKETGKTESAAIIQAQALYKRDINEHVQFKQFFGAKYALGSGKNSTYKAETSINTKLIETLQLKFSFTVDHNTEVAADKDNTDTQTAVTLVYSF